MRAAAEKKFLDWVESTAATTPPSSEGYSFMSPIEARRAVGQPDIVEAAFWRCVEKRAEDECWPWTGRTLKKDGRGLMTVDGKTTTAPRVAWKVSSGAKPPPELFVCHRCDNPNCVNPKHLWLGTNKDNITDASRKSRLGPKTAEAKAAHRALMKRLHAKNKGRAHSPETRAQMRDSQKQRRVAEREARHD